MIKNLQAVNKGFTIIESLVAITILILTITGVMGAVQIGISSYILSKDQVIAFYLAQEGFEQIRNIRDENTLKDQNWLTGISANSSDPCWFGTTPGTPLHACVVDPINSNVPTRCSGIGSCPVLRQSVTLGFYGHDPSWTATKFRREIVLTQINTNEISVLVTVNWSKGPINRQFRAKENLLNWQ